jgi:hypothetical protein
MKVPKTLVLTAGTAGLIAGGLWALEPALPNQTPPTQQQVQQNHDQRQIEDLSDADQNSKDRWRDEANDLVNAENDRKNTPGEFRPDLRFRFR